MKVHILLSTYNGERFLSEQIDSIRRQTFRDWTLLIRDDGSSDGTRRLIEEYCQKDERISFINPDDRTNLGVIRSFHALLQYERADYYFFSDQDDVWLEQKMELQLATAEAYPSDHPLLVYTDLTVVGQDLTVMSQSMMKSQSDHANTQLLQELTENTVTGGVAMINHSLAEYWTGQEEHAILMHDWYLALVASALGNLVYIDESTELYRQHEANVLGARTLKKRMRTWLFPQLLFSKYWKLIKDSQIQAKNLLALPLTDRDRALVENFVTLMDCPFVERFKRLRTYGYRKNKGFHTLVFTSLILTKFAYKE